MKASVWWTGELFTDGWTDWWMDGNPPCWFPSSGALNDPSQAGKAPKQESVNVKQPHLLRSFSCLMKSKRTVFQIRLNVQRVCVSEDVIYITVVMTKEQKWTFGTLTSAVYANV